jgi:GR25 family glycosyltransferase involved in LPS biosynthesis
VWLDCFDKVYCISLPFGDRREKIAAEFERVGIRDVRYIYATPPELNFNMSNMRRGARGEFGCNLSHIKAAFTALADRALWPLFLEDDVIFNQDAEKVMQSVVSELPPDWDILYMGGHPRGACHQVSDNLVRISAFSFAEAYALQRKALIGWLDFWCDNIGQKNAMVDMQLGRFASEHKGFCVYPTITRQPDGISQISGKHDSKDKCLKKGWANNLCTTDRPCKECADWLIRSA